MPKSYIQICPNKAPPSTPSWPHIPPCPPSWPYCGGQRATLSVCHRGIRKVFSNALLLLQLGRKQTYFGHKTAIANIYFFYLSPCHCVYFQQCPCIILFNNMCPQYPLASPLLTRVRLLWSQTHFCISCYGYGHHTTKKNNFFLKTGFSSAKAKALNKSLKQTPWVQAVQQSPTHTRPISWLSQNAKSVQAPNTNVWKSISSSGADHMKGEKDLVFKLWL